MSKSCSSCGVVKDLTEFYPRKDSKDGYKGQCKDCYAGVQKMYLEHNHHKFAAKETKRRAAKLERTPDWLSDTQLKEIENFYLISDWYKEDTHVDHIIPLQGKLVSGLHVPWNLQVIPAKDNLSKGNKF